jgi:beta-mannosidase
MVRVVELAGQQAAWEFRGGDAVMDWRPAEVPGCVHTDLMRHGLIPDPFYRMDEADVQWVDKQDWTYRLAFVVPPEVLAEAHVELVCDGLDTFADVRLNGRHILTADNMFRVWRVPVKDLLIPGDNELTVVFRSPIQEGFRRLEALGHELPAANDQSERGGVGSHVLSVFARKAPYHYGWDWGPRLVTSGIWRPVRLEAWTGPRIRDVFVRTVSADPSHANLVTTVEVSVDRPWSGVLAVSTDGAAAHQEVDLAPGTTTIAIPLRLSHPRLWWCRDLGAPELYTVTATLEQGGRAQDVATVRTGVRTLRLLQEPDAQGVSFTFELNGVPVFAKGANHIPNDSFVTRVTPDVLRREVETAAASHMNMLRVWGGGIYEDDRFYDLCDEHGILVWQDFMFACSMYPGDAAFLESVRHEAEDNIRRLRRHPCLALWCGNNEIDVAWQEGNDRGGWGWKQRYAPDVRAQIWRDYEALFHHLLPEVVSEWAPDTPYWPSSPMRALGPDRFRPDPPGTARGDDHYWGLGPLPEKTFQAYVDHVGRFMSEYGFQSLPDPRTVAAYTLPEDRALDTDVMRWHQRSGEGGRLITDFMEAYYPPPRDFAGYVRLSQMVQADGIQTAILAHRSRKPFCMGSLYWQINDCWPVASWSSMDYFGRWKPLQYVARRSFQDPALRVTHSDGRITIQVLLDGPESVQGSLHVRLRRILDGAVLREWRDDVTATPQGPVLAYDAPRPTDLEAGHPEALALEAVWRGPSGDALQTVHHYFARPRQRPIPPARLTVRTGLGEDGDVVAVTADHWAYGVWLTASEAGVFSDNAFDLPPGETRHVAFRRLAGDGWTAAAPGTVEASSLVDCVHG